MDDEQMYVSLRIEPVPGPLTRERICKDIAKFNDIDIANVHVEKAAAGGLDVDFVSDYWEPPAEELKELAKRHRVNISAFIEWNKKVTAMVAWRINSEGVIVEEHEGEEEIV